MGKGLELGVELGDPILDQEPQEVEATNEELLLRLLHQVLRVRVVRVQLKEVSLEGGLVAGLNREEDGLLKALARQKELLGRGCRLLETGRQGLEVRQVQLDLDQSVLARGEVSLGRIRLELLKQALGHLKRVHGWRVFFSTPC